MSVQKVDDSGSLWFLSASDSHKNQEITEDQQVKLYFQCSSRISVIQVMPSEGYYWDTKHGNFVAGIKMLFGASVGKTFDDSLEGTLRM